MKINKCKCGSNDILKCKDFSAIPYRYWLECMSCGFVGGIVYSKQRFSSITILQDGTEIIKSPEDDSVNLWNKEMSNND